MKSIILFSLCLVAVFSSAQTKIKASDIIKQINTGQAVDYSNVEIEGEFDLTNLTNRSLQNSSASNWDNHTYESTVQVALKFTNCTFLDDVLAYYHVERSQETYIAHFLKDVTFANCTFRQASEFKYSEFGGVINFSGSIFHAEANFKYAEFSQGPLFSNVKFDSGADFKYTEFPRETSFEKAVFHGLANFKYSQFRSPLNLNGVEFRGSEEFKYTKMDGRDFTAYLVNKQE